MIEPNRVIELAGQGWDPKGISEVLDIPLEEVQLVLARAGLDWKPSGSIGRPRIPALPGQQKYIEVAYSLGYSESTISVITRMSMNRVRRHIKSSGLQRPVKESIHESVKLSAVAMYIKGKSVRTIFDETNIDPSGLYKTLKRLGIPLRSRRKKRKQRGT